MNRIPKCRSKYYISQPINMNPSQKEQPKENMAQKLSKKTLKFTSSRHFGKDITNNIKSNVNSIYNKHNNKIVSIIEKKQNNNNTIYIKKHSSSSQVAQKNHKNNKSLIDDKKLRENKSGSMINNNKDINGINNNETKNEVIPTKAKLHSSISFGVNNNGSNTRPISSNTNNNSSTTVPIRLSNPKNINNSNNNKINGKINNRSISIHNSTSNLNYGNGINLNSNNNNSIVNNKNHNNIDLVKHIRSTTSRDSMINTINHSYYYNNSKGNKDSKRISEEIKIKKHSSQKRIIKKDFDENKENKNIENIKKETKKRRERKKSMENKDNNESKDIKENKEIKDKKEIKKENKDNNTNSKEKKIVKKIILGDNFITEEEDLRLKYFDTSKINNVQIPKDYLNIIYYNLLVEEKKGIIPMPDYTYMTRQTEINEKMRSILVDWLIDVHFKFGFTDETLFMTVSIIDRYLSISQVSRTNFQLLGITALMIACKHEEIDLPKIDDFIYITDNAYKKDEVKKMEFDVLSKLNFAFLYPSPIKFFEYLSNHFNFEKKQHMMGKYLMESFLLDVKNAKYKPSIISCACTYIVMKFFKMKNYQESYSKKFYVLDETKEKYSEHNIKECAKDICLFVDNINKTNYQACVKKYSKPEQENVAMLIMNN